MSDGVLAHLHTSYASQLENAGLWQWAVFVLLHLNNDTRYVYLLHDDSVTQPCCLFRRAKLVQDILSRHCSGDINLNEQERFIVDHLHVPTVILYEAKVNTEDY